MKASKSLMSGSTTMLVLRLLSEREMYGYEMIAELARRSDNTFELQEGTLYPLLHALERDGCLESSVRPAPGGKKRKYYRITRRGSELLAVKTDEWRNFASLVNELVFGFGGPAPSGEGARG